MISSGASATDPAPTKLMAEAESLLRIIGGTNALTSPVSEFEDARFPQARGFTNTSIAAGVMVVGWTGKPLMTPGRRECLAGQR